MSAALLRHQLPVHSPLPFSAVYRAARTAADGEADPAGALARTLCARYAAERAILFASGTQALSAAIRAALDATGSGIVAVPGYTCYDIITAAVGADARVVPYDIDPATLGPVPDSLARAFEAGARVAVAAALYGIPFDWGAVRDLASAHEAVLIEDAAQGAGASWQGRLLGSLGELSILSFGRGKGWTGAGGGALLLRGSRPYDLDLPPNGHERLQPASLAAAGAQWLLGRPRAYGLPRALPWLRLGETVYHDPEPGRAMGRFNAALALATEAASRAEVELRRANAAELARTGLPRPACLPDADSCGWLRFPTLVPNSERIAAALRAFGAERGYPTTLARLPQAQSRLAALLPLPGAERLARETVTFPTHRWVSERDLAAIRRVFPS